MASLTKFVEDQYIDNLKKNKYRGGDNSIYYNYIISPVCNYFINYFPKN